MGMKRPRFKQFLTVGFLCGGVAASGVGLAPAAGAADAAENKTTAVTKPAQRIPQIENPKYQESAFGMHLTRTKPLLSATGDVTGDGTDNTVVADNTAKTIKVLDANGKALEGYGYDHFLTDRPDANVTAITVGDWSGDGKAEIGVAYTGNSFPNPSSNFLTVLGRIDGSSVMHRLAPQHSFPSQSAATALAFGDVNGDGKAALVAVYSWSDRAYGGPAFNRNVNARIIGRTPQGHAFHAKDVLAGKWPEKDITAVAFHDFNGDGKQEMILGTDSNAGNPRCFVYEDILRSDKHTFSGCRDWDPGGWPTDFTVADVRGTGRPQLIMSRGGQAHGGISAHIMEQQGTWGSNWTLTDRDAIKGPSKGAVEVVDPKGDGKPTLMLGGFGTQSSKATPEVVVLDRLRSTEDVDPLWTGKYAEALKWWPGNRQGSVSVQNATDSALRVSLSASDKPEHGCWVNKGEDGAAGFPESVSVGKSQTSSPFGLTTTHTSGCYDADARFAWVTVADPDRPDSRTVVKLRVTDSTINVDSVATAGSFKVTASQAAEPVGNRVGAYVLKVEPLGVQASLTTKPKLAGKQLTSGVDRNVYRFHVTDTTWKYPDAAPEHAAIPAYTVQTMDGSGQWKDHGRLLPTSEPSVSGSDIKLGEAVFYYEEETGKPVKQFRVGYGDGKYSEAVELKSLTAPTEAITGKIASLKMFPSKEVGTSATVSANGVHQEPGRLEMEDADYREPVNEIKHPDLYKMYDLVYFRDAGDNKKLITGLHNKDGYVSATPIRGRYGDDPMTMAAASADRDLTKIFLSNSLNNQQRRATSHLTLDGSTLDDSAGVYLTGTNTNVRAVGSIRTGLELECSGKACFTANPKDQVAIYHGAAKTANPYLGVVRGYTSVTAGSALSSLRASDKPQTREVTVTGDSNFGQPKLEGAETSMSAGLITSRGDYAYVDLNLG